ncbi:D-isomer specific 2-hydroxyacid dehydrogenase family protein [Pseudomonas sp. PDM13]|uniref:D-isomer specific 2-hydroxyacid dehydrogenase family protein n=1 Tax=Pseudomonas sp. PDM13 TaxID=2769255 RepID=UPI0021E0CE27|nr:D-isomer specific 2-hydroxyacid dehydrogenase family protein [Pseudomonas sp. PDM13]MCU9949264.1 D-isomer specific 2-hydroxyacid dehydrogenase family protein [Pseudomonas sp. PDM13]
MTAARIASQLDAGFNALLRERLPGVEVLDLPRGLPQALPAGVQALLAAPHPALRDAAEPPPGWPFGLGFVQLVSSGLDFFPRWLLDGPPVASARGATASSIAEFALAAIFAAAKQLPELWIDNAEAWQQRPLASLAGSTLGLYGFGSIARELARKARALDMQVLALRRSAQPFGMDGVQRAADIHELFARADHLVLAAPATAETQQVVNRETLASARPGLHLINVARGSLVDQAALLQALDEGRLALASLDVTEPEPLPAGHPFYSHPRVRLSPHTSANTPQVYRNLAALLARNLERFQSGQPLENLVQAGRGY